MTILFKLVGLGLLEIAMGSYMVYDYYKRKRLISCIETLRVFEKMLRNYDKKNEEKEEENKK